MSSRVYVGRISREVRERDIERFFGTVGEIRSVTIKNGFAFVEYRDYRDAEDCVHDFHGKEFFGERVVCELARGERRRQPESSARDKYGPMQRTQYRCLVENLSPQASWQDLKDFMRRAGQVTYADCHKQREGEGVVEFLNEEDLREALRRLDDQDLKGSRVVLREVKSEMPASPRGSRRYDRSVSPRRRRSDDSRRRHRSPSPRRRDVGGRDSHRDGERDSDRSYRDSGRDIDRSDRVQRENDRDASDRAPRDIGRDHDRRENRDVDRKLSPREREA